MEPVLPYWANYMKGKDEFVFKIEKTEYPKNIQPQNLIQPQQLVQSQVQLQSQQLGQSQVQQCQPQQIIPVKFAPVSLTCNSPQALVRTEGEVTQSFDSNLLSQISPELAAQLASISTQNVLKQFNVPTAQVMLLANQQQQLANAKRNRVKRPMNSFLLFSNEMRPILQAQNKDQSNAQISKLLGNSWKALPSEDKTKYVERAAKIKTDFSAAHPDYVYTKTPRKHKKRKLSVEKELSETLESNSPISSSTSSEMVHSYLNPNDFSTYENFLTYDLGQPLNSQLLSTLHTITPAELSTEDRLVSEVFE